MFDTQKKMTETYANIVVREHTKQNDSYKCGAVTVRIFESMIQNESLSIPTNNR